MNHDKKFMKELETSQGLTYIVARNFLEQEMKLSYRQAIRELLFTAIKCRSDS